MQITTDFKKVTPNNQKPSGGYEWWYFDGISSDEEWSFVIIFYQGNPFSPEYIQHIEQKNAKPEEFPAVSISIYHNSKTEFYSFLEYEKEDFLWEDNKLTIGKNSFQQKMEGDNLLTSIRINEELPSQHSIKAELTLSSQLNDIPNMNSRSSNEVDHIWNLIQPSAKVSGNIDIKGKRGIHQIDFNGTGYHDHNTGFEPMKDDFDDWYWGRFHFGKYTLIYYIMNRLNEQQHQAWLLDNNNKIVAEFMEAELSSEGITAFGLKSARKIVLSSDNAEITIQSSTSIDNGPFYQRFLGEAILRIGDEILPATGISEYIKPERIYAKQFWPLVRMRLRFTSKKVHWVQNSKMFYQWTW